jgi:hypothetical protein
MWPIDELASLDHRNIARLFSMLDERNLIMFSAFPSQDPTLIKHFTQNNVISPQGIQIIPEKKQTNTLNAIRERNKTLHKSNENSNEKELKS